MRKEIKGVFKPPIKKWYFGKVQFGTPYMYPWNYEPYFISCRILKETTQEYRDDYLKRFPHLRDSNTRYKFTNYPMVTRNKHWIIKMFGKYIYVSIGYPIVVHKTDLGWKTKWDSVRFEWSPSFSIFFFGLQYIHWWNSPDGNNDKYYEMILHWLHYSNKDIKKAEETWGWIDTKTKQSTWNKDYLI